MCMIWNIPTQDNDGNVQSIAKISDRELSAIRDMLIANGDEKHEADLAKALGVASLEELPSSGFKRAMSILEARMTQKAKAPVQQAPVTSVKVAGKKVGK